MEIVKIIKVEDYEPDEKITLECQCRNPKYYDQLAYGEPREKEFVPKEIAVVGRGETWHDYPSGARCNLDFINQILTHMKAREFEERDRKIEARNKAKERMNGKTN